MASPSFPTSFPESVPFLVGSLHALGTTYSISPQMSFSPQDTVHSSWTTCLPHALHLQSPHTLLFPHSPIPIIPSAVFLFVPTLPCRMVTPGSDDCQAPEEGCCLVLNAWPLTPFTMLIPTPSCPLLPTSTLQTFQSHSYCPFPMSPFSSPPPPQKH